MKLEETMVFCIEAGYSDLRPSEKKAADFVLEHMSRIRELSLAQLAKCSGVSQPTIVRMVKSLGFESYKAFKYAVIEEQGQGKQPAVQPLYGYQVSKEDRVEEVPAKIAATAFSIMESTIKSISLKTYRNVIQVISSARQIDIYGIENSSAACCDLAAKLLYLGLNCRYLADPYLQQISAGSLTSQDAAIAISYSGTSKDTVEAVKLAREQDAATIVITNFEDAYISKYADYLIGTAQEQHFYGNAIFSRTAQILIVDMIYMGLLTSDYQTYAQRLDRNSGIIKKKAY